MGATCLMCICSRRVSLAVSWKDIMKSLRRRSDEIKELFPVFEEVRSKRLVDNARSSAIIGCGYGESELAFLKHCIPSLEVLSALEPDIDSVVELTANIARQLSNVHVRTAVYQDVAESWAADTDQVFDVVIMFHCVNEFPEPTRRLLFSRLFESVIKPNGLLIITTRTGLLDGTRTMENRIMEALNRRPCLDHKWYEEARQQLESVGFVVCYERRYAIDVNLENLDEGYFGLHARLSDQPTSLETAERVTRSVVGDAKKSRREFIFGVFRKPLS